ncbi:hypothetical protein HDV00_007643 [Rhizophlyctis rosea]|nr:hypothetical protein HDV00_007643 [Rhizophlyctis rosea]
MALFERDGPPCSLTFELVIYPTTEELSYPLPPVHVSSPSLHLTDTYWNSKDIPPTTLPSPTTTEHNSKTTDAPSFDTLDTGDVIIKLKDGIMKAHRDILVTRAPESYFSAVLSLPMQEQATRFISLADVDCAMFKEILRFIYTGHLYVRLPQLMDNLIAIYMSVSDDICITQLEASN